ncbi:MAG: acylneuraminate cytidylyltransferase family protein [Bacteroidia bacterium]|nr:acylneuraminate cytidylyltransferase family protein [Bacteroidia bacterium]
MNYQIIIPARGGSKRFPKKNIYPLKGIPLIAHSIIYGIDSGFADKIWVNTDNKDIANIALKFGAKTTIRPLSIASDTTPTVVVLQHQLSHFKNINVPCDAIILLQATNPLRPKGLLKEAIDIFENMNLDSLATFSKLNKKYGQIIENKFIPENYKIGQRMQELSPRYFENGQLYICKASAIKNLKIITDDCYPLICNHPYSEVDIDIPSDMLLAEFLLNQAIIK